MKKVFYPHDKTNDGNGSSDLFFSAGDPSGDIHASHLIAELRRRFPEAEFIGFGGPKMEEVGCKNEVRLTDLAVMWVGRVLWNIRTFLGYFKRAEKIFEQQRPDAVILVDFPGFNWHIAKRAKKAGIPVYYFMPPQIWAWAQWRVRKLQKWVDHTLCCFEFEKRWFADHQCDVACIGHPFLEEVRNRRCDESFIDSVRERFGSNRRILLLLPGSRTQEVAQNLPDMLKAAQLIRKNSPVILPVIAAFDEAKATMVRKQLNRLQIDESAETGIPVFVARTPELMKIADVAIAVSGSVSIELLAFRVPSVIYYRVGRFGLWLSRFFRKVKYITLTNLLAVDESEPGTIFYENRWMIPRELPESEKAKEVFPEFLTNHDASEPVATTINRWIDDPQELSRITEQLDRLLKKIDSQGSPIQNAAEYIEGLGINN